MQHVISYRPSCQSVHGSCLSFLGAFRHSRTNHRHGKTIRRQDERLLAALSVPNETGRMAVADYKLPLVNKETVTTLESEQSSNPAF